MLRRMELIAEPIRTVKKSSSFNQLNSSSLADNARTKPVMANTDDEEWCEVRPSNVDPVNESLWQSTEGYNVENILLYLIDMSILSAEQIKWEKFCQNIDFSTDPGAIKDPVPAEENEGQPSTSAQALSTSNEDEGESSANNSSEMQDNDDPSEKVVRALMNYFQNKSNTNSGSFMQIPYIDAPQNLIQLYNHLPEPQNEFFIVDGLEIRLRNSTWRPPKKTFIFDLHEFQYDFVTMLSNQGNVCAGCGLKLQKRRLSFCHYFNKLFCKLCFQGHTAKIPSHILHKWDFKEYPVSDMAHKFLFENEDQPVFDIHVIEASLFRKVKNLREIRSLRIKICHLWEYIKRCRNAELVTTKYGPIRTVFQSIPSRFLNMEQSFMYSILDLCNVESGNLNEMLRPLDIFGTLHVTKCKLCEQRGFFCLICMDPNQIIFPFQLKEVFRCVACGSLAHLKCYKKQMSKNKVFVCSRCERIRRKRLLHLQNFESSNSD
ncbi:DUF4206 domain-containing protein [Aphelenchoides bicaudatus]|nr:DUF4206 domain-containing protein [Aphelenchoides bicaudatus]